MMKRLIEFQKWDTRFTCTRYIYVEDGSYDIFEYIDTPNRIKINGLYIQIPYRCRGYAELFMKDIFETYKGKEIIIMVRKLPWIMEWYSKYGFKHYQKCKFPDNDFKWMIKKYKKIHYVRVGEVEKKKYGEVITPLELVMQVYFQSKVCLDIGLFYLIIFHKYIVQDPNKNHP